MGNEMATNDLSCNCSGKNTFIAERSRQSTTRIDKITKTLVEGVVNCLAFYHRVLSWAHASIASSQSNQQYLRKFHLYPVALHKYW